MQSLFLQADGGEVYEEGGGRSGRDMDGSLEEKLALLLTDYAIVIIDNTERIKHCVLIE